MIEYRSLQPAELDAWFDHCACVFGGAADCELRGLFVNHHYMDPDSDSADIIAAVDNGRIISALKLFNRTGYFFGDEFTISGIGDFGTVQEYRGQGISYRLMERAVKRMEEREIDISMLRGTERMYDKLGWRNVRTYTQISTAEAGIDKWAYSLRPADLEQDLPALKGVYTGFSSRFNGPFARNDDFYWRYWVKFEGANVWVIEDGAGAVIGYVGFTYRNGGLDIGEFCVQPAHEGIFDNVAARLVALTGRLELEVRFDSLIPSRLAPNRFEEQSYIMYRLMKPLNVNGREIENTEQLLELLAAPQFGDVPRSDVLFWGVDSF
ncbi:acetyltransferase (GNAT) family protein [Paenibacillus taihuensis]|uniref:Acetyltransferase (GNAT) family protein n=1 Tax=Paenibacillus taihuensis TaxID=1156355 RepID=A0A3D9QXN4_9BACL|nr:GNAT family N-acetyltransferase [Paenibacillus taihuensis]REE69562.1 acetyltransferase (GNAT) family protein [Paenibacillus taihuensis]